MGGLSGTSTITTEWILLALALLFVATRMVVRLVNQQKHLLTSDLFLLVSWLFALALGITDTMTYKNGGLESEYPEDPDTIIRLGKIAFASNYFYDTCIYFPKLSILALYTRLIPNTLPKLRLALSMTIGFVVISCLTTCFADTFWCGSDVASNWSLEEGACSSFNALPLFYLDWSLNFISDVFIFALPFPLFRSLKLQRRQFYGLLFTFGLGVITIAVNVARFATILHSSNFNSVYIWSMAEMATSIIVACLPALRPLLRRAGEVSSTDPKSSKSRITRIFDSVLSRTGVSALGSSRVDRTGSRRGKGIDRMERLSDGGDSQLELTTQSRAPGIYKSQDVVVQSTQINQGDSKHRVPGLGNSATALYEI